MSKENDKFIGKKLLFSVVYKDGTGGTINRKQGLGLITGINEAGVFLQMPDGSEFSLPPDTDFQEGIQGAKYTLKDGTVVESPDYTITYTVFEPRK